MPGSPSASAMSRTCWLNAGAASSARWATYCGIVRARSSTLDGGAPERWRRSNGPGPSTNQSVLFRHLTNANTRAWQHSRRSRSCRYQIGGCCTSRQNSSSPVRCGAVGSSTNANLLRLAAVRDNRAPEGGFCRLSGLNNRRAADCPGRGFSNGWYAPSSKSEWIEVPFCVNLALTKKMGWFR